jgi:hypothetical protein
MRARTAQSGGLRHTLAPPRALRTRNRRRRLTVGLAVSPQTTALFSPATVAPRTRRSQIAPHPLSITLAPPSPQSPSLSPVDIVTSRSVVSPSHLSLTPHPLPRRGRAALLRHLPMALPTPLESRSSPSPSPSPHVASALSFLSLPPLSPPVMQTAMAGARPSQPSCPPPLTGPVPVHDAACATCQPARPTRGAPTRPRAPSVRPPTHLARRAPCAASCALARRALAQRVAPVRGRVVAFTIGDCRAHGFPYDAFTDPHVHESPKPRSRSAHSPSRTYNTSSGLR